jgi:amino acid transporter
MMLGFPRIDTRACKDGPFGTYLLAQVHNMDTAKFLGFWATLTNALFAYIGTELIGVTVGEAENPRRNIREC